MKTAKPFQPVRPIALLLLVMFAVQISQAAKPATPPADPAPVDTAILVIVDPAVQAELKLGADQKKAIDAELNKVDRPMWVLRDLPPEKGRDRLAALIESFERNVRSTVRPPQRQRLDEIILQYRGPQALLQPELAETLGLSEHQRKQVRAVVEDTRKKMQALGQAPADEQSTRKHYQAIYELRTREQKLLMAILSEQQKQTWSAKRGERFDLTRIQPHFVRAPELEDADRKEAWVNSPPLSMAELAGQVVVVHFWTFGCGNCIHNYEWYRNWQRDFAGKGVTIIGIHTPETQGERNLETLRKKAQENRLTFPILVDNHRQNWDAWGNNMWPSVYLVDRQGRVRYWWYGELKWGGRDGEKIMRGRIEELLAESNEAPASQKQ